MGETAQALLNFIKGKRTKYTNWCDWDIPIHWGGMSDPFQPCEKHYKRSLEALKVFAETQYPVVVSTKGKLCIEEPYISLIEQCNIVMQVSMLSSKYDKLEQGAPPYEQRLEMVRVLSKKCKRVIIRHQPYIHDLLDDILENIPRLKEAGAYGVIVEGMKFVKKKPGLEKSGADYVQPKELLKMDFSKIKAKCGENDLAFFVGENRLRSMGDSLTCCGVGDLEGFRPNTFNINHIINGDKTEPTPAMLKPDTADAFKAMDQTAAFCHFIDDKSFAYMMKWYYDNRKKYIESVMR
jgi:DNA repair photolyase